MRTTEEEDRTPVGRSDFKSGETRTTCLVGSTPTLFRQPRTIHPVPAGRAAGVKRRAAPAGRFAPLSAPPPRGCETR